MVKRTDGKDEALRDGLLKALTLALILLAAPASAIPITSGTWSATPLPTLDVDKSEDCSTCGIAWLLPVGTEALAGGFGYTDWPGGTLVSRQTDYTDGVLAWDGLSFSYANGHGFASSSWDGLHQRLYRLLAPTLVTYWMGIEDLPNPAVWDYNDLVLTWSEPVGGPPETPPSVPEPSLLALLGIGAIGVWRRAKNKCVGRSFSC